MAQPSRSSRPFSRLRWALARAVLIVTEDGYTTDEALAAELRLDYNEVRLVVGVLYRQRRLDRADGYLVLPADRHLELARPAEVA